ncbi:3-oxoacyl-[acyl-carrier-protein] synthase III [Lachnotalea glycerini]|uniref:Beta-ketoacyl-[acyl-carrier-protein] synthase III n=1 Tax=Lachnotalea glycerini TaxID=1763509 RepID=A0A318ELE0_9FIRM|nr:beta-ketoacyl-ACP synthase III [Lachnotalea glycerini]PXV85396.1 3-oxoacyl-[acyl-carrier-protein] synthase III [Lachnotalea glycerini]RDY30376.1 ketoacyl-ACP synthase III [Lachnotalea glycerini]
MSARIIGTGSALPEHIVTNEYLSTIVETSDEWIRDRTGIKERRIAKEETTSTLASLAAKRALENAGIDRTEIDLIIVATFTPDSNMPSTACVVQQEIGAANAFCFDIGAACTGFLYALSSAYAYIQAGMCKNAVVIGAETISKTVDWTDRGTCVLFGDGAGAVVISEDKMGKMTFVQGSDGSKGNVLTYKGRSLNNLLVKNEEENSFIYMDGQEVFKFAVKKVPECIEELLEKTNTDRNEVKFFCLHQANRRIISSVAKRLKQSEDKFPVNLDQYGNTSAASIPILLDELYQRKQIEAGDKIVISGFGGGLTWGAALIE